MDGAPGADSGLARAVLVAVCVLLAFLVGRAAAGLDPFSHTYAVPVLSQKDALPYRVHLTGENVQEAADTMAKLNAFAIEVMRHLREKFVFRGEGTPEQRDAVKLMLRNYNPDNLVENSHRDPAGDTSYSLDKGRVLAFCMRSKRTGKLLPLHLLQFVALHEITHLAIPEYDHPPRFWSAFKFILLEVEAAGLYVSTDYSLRPVDYCGLTVSSNPRYDPGVVPI